MNRVLNVIVLVSLIALVACDTPAGPTPQRIAIDTPPPPPPPPPPRTIRVEFASYGGNCNVGAVGNHTALLKAKCDNTTTCNYPLTSANTGPDPCNQVRKDFDWAYTCTPTADVKHGHIAGEALGSIATLLCP